MHLEPEGGGGGGATGGAPMGAVPESDMEGAASASVDSAGAPRPPVPRVVSMGALRMRDAAAGAAGGGFASVHAARVAARRGSDYSWAPSGKPSRALSMVRLQSEANRNLTGVEARDQGNVSGRVIGTYVKAGGGWLVVAFIAALMALEQGTRVFTDTWLGFWATNRFAESLWFYLGIYAACGIGYSFVVYCRWVGVLRSWLGFPRSGVGCWLAPGEEQK